MTFLFTFYDCFDHLLFTPLMRKEFLPYSYGEGQITGDLAFDETDRGVSVTCTHSLREEDTAHHVPQEGLISGQKIKQRRLREAGLVVTRERDDPKLFWKDVVGWFE